MPAESETTTVAAATESARRERIARGLFAATLALVVVLKLAFFARHYRDTTLAGFWNYDCVKKLALAAAFRSDASRAGQIHVPTFEAVRAQALQSRVFPETYPETPERTEPAEWRVEFDQDIGYGLVMGALWRLFGTNRVALMVGLQVLLDLAVVLGLAWAGRVLAGRLAGALVAIGYLTCDPVAIAVLYPTHYYWPVLATGLAVPFVTFVWRHGSEGGKRPWVVAASFGLFLALVCSVRSAALFVVPVAGALVFALGAIPRRRRLGLVAVFGAGFVLGALPLAVRNAREFGALTPRRGTFWHYVLCGIGEADPASGWLYDDRRVAARVHERHGDAVGYLTPAYEVACREEAQAYFAAHPLFYPERVVALFPLALAKNRSWPLAFLPILAAALAGLVAFARREREKRLPALIAPLALWLAITAGVAIALMPTYDPLYREGSEVMLYFALALGLGAFVERHVIASLAWRERLATGGLGLAAFLGPHVLALVAPGALAPYLEALGALALGWLAPGERTALALLVVLLWTRLLPPQAALAVGGCWLGGVALKLAARRRAPRG